MNQKEELKRDLLESLKLTPKDKRHLTVISFKGTEEIHTSTLSMNRVDSSFSLARKDLFKKLKRQKTSQTYGWDNGKVIVYREIEYDYPLELLKDPKIKEEYFKYGFLKDFDTVKNIKFIVEYKDKSREVFYVRNAK